MQKIESSTFLNNRIQIVYHAASASYAAMVNNKPVTEFGKLVLDCSKLNLIGFVHNAILNNKFPKVK